MPPGRDRDIKNYYSIQHQFPANYGIGSLGLPESASPQRRAQAKQLKAYLMFFDQLLANYFSQLAHVGDLFSFSGPADRTYFSQPITDSSLALDDILKLDAEELQRLTETSAQPSSQPDFSRRHRFLNHLLARFAEQFTDYSLILYGAVSQAEKTPAMQVVQDKQAFLQDYPRLSSERGTAFNYLQPRSRENISGLERRLQRKLGITAPAEEFYLVEHILLRPIAADRQQQVPILASAQRKDPYSLQLSFVLPDWPDRFKSPEFRTFVERTIREETPAHLVVNIHRLDQTAMEGFKTVYFEWLEQRRAYWANQLEE